MSQSGFIAAMLLAAFIIWLAVNDRLTAYTSVLFGPTQQPKPQGNISDQNGIIAPAAIGAGGAAGGVGGFLDFLPDILGGGSGGAGLLESIPDAAPLLLLGG